MTVYTLTLSQEQADIIREAVDAVVRSNAAVVAGPQGGVEVWKQAVHMNARLLWLLEHLDASRQETPDET